MTITLVESLSGFGNSNHWGVFLSSYEKGIEENNEVDMPLAQAPNYFAWINIACEQVFYRIREMIYVNEENYDVFDWPYICLVDHIFDNYEPTDEQKESILLFAKIRHLIVHKGFPNPYTIPSENSRKIAKEHLFTPDDVRLLAERLQSPKYYHELREQYRMIMEAIGLYENNFAHNFGFMQISNISSD